MATKVKLGDKITFTHTLIRKRDTVRNNVSPYPDRLRAWEKKNHHIKRGIIIGIRRLSNGKIIGYNEDRCFMPKEYFLAYLVAYDLRKKPVYVKIEEDGK